MNFNELHRTNKIESTMSTALNRYAIIHLLLCFRWCILCKVKWKNERWSVSWSIECERSFCCTFSTRLGWHSTEAQTISNNQYHIPSVKSANVSRLNCKLIAHSHADWSWICKPAFVEFRMSHKSWACARARKIAYELIITFLHDFANPEISYQT